MIKFMIYLFQLYHTLHPDNTNISTRLLNVLVILNRSVLCFVIPSFHLKFIALCCLNIILLLCDFLDNQALLSLEKALFKMGEGKERKQNVYFA